MTTIPKNQEKLHALADALLMPLLFGMSNEEIGMQLRLIIADLSRRPRARQAPVVSRSMTAALYGQLRQYAIDHPDMTYQQIGELFGVQGARVSEAVAGKRK